MSDTIKVRTMQQVAAALKFYTLLFKKQTIDMFFDDEEEYIKE